MDRSLYSINSDKQIKLTIDPTHKSIPTGNGNLETIRSFNSNLFYANTIGYAAQSLQSSITRQMVLGGRSWNALVHDNFKIQQLYSLWFNSIFGLIISWTQGSRSQPGRSILRTKSIKRIPIPDFNSLDKKELDLADKLFQKISTLELKPVLQMQTDETRHMIDQAILDVLKLPNSIKDDLPRLRELFCNEPTIRGKSKQ